MKKFITIVGLVLISLAPIFANETNTANTNENPQIVLVYVNGIWLVTYTNGNDENENDIIL